MQTFTTEEIEREIEQLDGTEARAALYYLRQELTRRRNAGRRASSETVSGRTRKDQNRYHQKEFRKRQREAK